MSTTTTARPSGNNTYIRMVCGLLAITAGDVARAYARCRSYGPDVDEEQATEAYWAARLARPWLQLPQSGPTAGSGVAGQPNPDWVAMTQPEEGQFLVCLRMYAPDILFLRSEDHEALILRALKLCRSE